MILDAKTKLDREAKKEILKDIIRDLHRGGDVEVLKKRFGELVRDVSGGEIGTMEQELIAEGLPEEEVRKLCDVHVRIFEDALACPPAPATGPGHPLHTLAEENRALERVVAQAQEILTRLRDEPGHKDWPADRVRLASLAASLAEIEKHYLKKENQLFPVLESKGVSGPSKVMWAIHDDIRLMIKEVRGLLAEGRSVEVVTAGRRLADMMADMIYKEDKVLLPLSVETLDEKDWARVKKGEEEIGYAWVKPGAEWKPAVDIDGLPPLPGYQRPAAALRLDTGELAPEQVNLLLKNLPLDVTFVDETDTVRYFSAGAERIFPRSPGVIGRKVQNCHPPDSVQVVNLILDAFRKGERQAAEFWIQSRGRFIQIRYFALRDEAGRYRGCLEVSQDVSSARGLQGERRLLDWK